MASKISETRTLGSSSSTANEPERLRRCKDIRSRTLILRLDPEGKPYSRLDIAHGLVELPLFKENFEQIECLGPLNRNCEWYITLRSESSKLRLLTEIIKINGKIGHFMPAGTSEYRARVHWLPHWVDNKSLLAAFQAHNLEVVQICTDHSTVQLDKTHSLRSAAITTRSVVLRTDNINKIPHVMKVRDDAHGEEWDALITVPRRPPLCLRCRQIGHVRGKCVAAFCGRCRRFGHKEPECKLQQNSYAHAAGSGLPKPMREEADMDEDAIQRADTEPSKEAKDCPDIEKEHDDSRSSQRSLEEEEKIKQLDVQCQKVPEPARPASVEDEIPLRSSQNETDMDCSSGVKREVVHLDEDTQRGTTLSEEVARSASWADQSDTDLESLFQGEWITPSPMRRRGQEKRRRERSSPRRGSSLSPSPNTKKK